MGWGGKQDRKPPILSLVSTINETKKNTKKMPTIGALQQETVRRFDVKSPSVVQAEQLLDSCRGKVQEGGCVLVKRN